MNFKRVFKVRAKKWQIASVLSLCIPMGSVFAQQTGIIINEVDADQTGTDNAEFVELYDGGLGNTDLSGLTLVLYNGSSDTSYQAFDLDGLTTNSDGYFVLCGDAANTPNCDLDVAPDTNLVQNGADAVALYTADASAFPGGTAVTDVDLIDALVYDTNDSDDTGLLSVLTPGMPQVNEGENGLKDTESNQRCLNGSGGARNTDTYAQHAPTPGEANTCGIEPPADVMINEVDADQSGTDSAEFVELYDGGAGNTDLSGLTLVFFNGNGDSAYQKFDLDGFSTSNDGYFVLCANATNTPNCDLDVSPDTNLIQNGADAVALYADEPENITTVTTTNLVDALVYDTSDSDDAGLLVLLNPGQPQVNENGTGNGATESNQRCANGTGGLRNTDTYAQHAPTPGAENTCGGAGGGDPDPGGEFGVCLDPATMIHAIQGNGDASPMNGTSGVIIEGIVTADYQASGLLGGFFVQEEDADADADPTTSEGIFVLSTSTDVNVGDLVRVQGSVTEFFDLTEINNVTQVAVCSSGGSVTPASVTLPVSSLDEYEQVEGMLINIAQPLTVNENFNLARFGEVVLSDGRVFQYTHNNLPDAAGYAAHVADLPLNQIILDDARTAQNPDPVIHPAGGLSASNTLRGGSVASITGVMSYGFGSYRIQPVGDVLFSENPRPEAPEDVGGNFKVAGINVLNYFTTIDTGASVCGANGNLGCRGADSADELARQRAKLLSAMTAIDADIFGLVELENNASQSISDLVSGLNDAAGPGTYAFVDTGTIGTDAIKVGLVYKPASASPTGSYAILDSSVDPTFIDDKNRPVLAQTFTTSTGEVLTIAVNHFKSKGSNCNDVGDPDLNDGQGNCSVTRANASSALANWLATDPTSSGDEDFLILGDLNAYAQEVAITNLTGAGYTNLIETFAGTQTYSFVFGAQAGYLDHALATSGLTDKVSDVTEWHINADEPRALDYNTEFKSAGQVTSFYAPDAYRSSDHDPVIIGFNFEAAPIEYNYDLTGNGVVDIYDFALLLRAIRFGPAPGPESDFNNDGKVDMLDAREILKNCTNRGCR